MADTKRQFKGVQRGQEVSRAARREDTRTFNQKLAEWTSSEVGTIKVFGFLAGAAIVTSWAPFLPEVIFIIALTILLNKYDFKTRRWSLPMRVPAYLSQWMDKAGNRKILDATTKKAGDANLYLGMDLESGEEVWVSTNDVNKHALMIGTTGSGKTEAIMGQLAGFQALGSGSMVVDGKASANTFDSTYKICRSLGRDCDLFVIDYLTGGKDIIGPQQHRRSHSYNPLGFGGSAQKSEVMVSLLDGGDDMWKGRAIQYLEGVVPPLAFLSEQGFLLLNPTLLEQFLNLNVIENLVLFGLIQDLNGKLIWLKGDYPAVWNALQARIKGLELYLYNVPSFNITRNNEPIYISGMDAAEFEAVKPRIIAVRDKSLDAPGDKQQRGKTEEQHGYITMQLSRSIGALSKSYGFIYDVEIGDISFYDIVLNRRSLVVLLPSLERSTSNLSMLGKLTVLSLKSVLGSLLNTAPEGARRQIIEGNPSNADIPYQAVLDEVGYYIVEGISVIPAQARSLGVAVYFGTQDIPSLSKGSEAEGKAILENTALKMIGRLASDTESETARTARDLAGKVSTQVASGMEFKRDSLGFHNKLKLSDDSSLDEEYRVNYADLTRQENGEFHTILGTKEFNERGQETGGQRLSRLKAFFTGNVKNLTDWRRNPFVQVKLPSVSEISVLRETERAERRFRTRISDVMASPSDAMITLGKAARHSLIGEFIEFRRAQIAKLQNGEVDAWDVSDPSANLVKIGEWHKTRKLRLESIKDIHDAQSKIDKLRALSEKCNAAAGKTLPLPTISARWTDALIRSRISAMVDVHPTASSIKDILTEEQYEKFRQYDAVFAQQKALTDIKVPDNASRGHGTHEALGELGALRDLARRSQEAQTIQSAS